MEKIRIGVFICHCGSNIGSVIECNKLAMFARNLPNVVFTQDNLYTCSETGLTQIRNGIVDNHLNRVLVAACTPRTHEPLFRSICEEMGMNPYFFEFVNIREQCSWVHQKEVEKANSKVRDLIRMGVARASLLEPLENNIVDMLPSAVILGGGIAGMTVALNLANQGYEVKLIERGDKLGGRLNKLYKIFPDNLDSSEILKIKEIVQGNNKIEVLLNSSLKNVEGYVGNFDVTVLKNGEVVNLKSGVIIISTGSEVLDATKYYNYNGNNIITQQELEQKFIDNSFNSQNIVMIQCVGSRIEERSYCSQVCCMTALKNAQVIKEKNPNANVIILYRDLHAPGSEYENYYKTVRELGVIFIKYDLDKPPIVENDKITINNSFLKGDLEIKHDLVVLSTPMTANQDSKEISQMLKVPLEENGFFLEAHVKLRPVDFATDGIFVCGSTKWPSSISETISQANAAAARAASLLSKKEIEVAGATAFIDEEKCVGCEICIQICPYNAIAKDEEGNVVVREVLCKGCGVCGATCTKHAIMIKHYKDDQILSQILSLDIGSG